MELKQNCKRSSAGKQAARNRTRMELKHVFDVVERTRNQPRNRTRMELKPAKEDARSARMQARNRTRMELKRFTWLALPNVY